VQLPVTNSILGGAREENKYVKNSTVTTYRQTVNALPLDTDIGSPYERYEATQITFPCHETVKDEILCHPAHARGYPLDNLTYNEAKNEVIFSPSDLKEDVFIPYQLPQQFSTEGAYQQVIQVNLQAGERCHLSGLSDQDVLLDLQHPERFNVYQNINKKQYWIELKEGSYHEMVLYKIRPDHGYWCNAIHDLPADPKIFPELQN